MNHNVSQALLFLINTVFWLYILAVMLRFLLQWVRADFYNPVSQVVIKVTNPLLLPLRRVIPGYRGLDFAAVVLMLILQFANVALVVWLLTASMVNPLLGIYWVLLKLLVILINLYFFSILIQALMSWFSPGAYNPVASLLWTLNEPVLRPFRRVIPPLGGLDFSPLVAMLLLQAVNILIPLPGILR